MYEIGNKKREKNTENDVSKGYLETFVLLL